MARAVTILLIIAAHCVNEAIRAAELLIRASRTVLRARAQPTRREAGEATP